MVGNHQTSGKKWLALEFEDGMIEQNIHPAENERMSTLKKESFQGKNCLPTLIFEEVAVSFVGSTYGKSYIFA